MKKITTIFLLLVSILGHSQLPTTNLKLTDIISVLNASQDTTLSKCCTSVNVNKFALNPTYCPGFIPDIMLGNLQTEKKQSYFKGYEPVTVVDNISFEYTYLSGSSTSFTRVYLVYLIYNNPYASFQTTLYFKFENEDTPPSGQTDRTQCVLSGESLSPVTFANGDIRGVEETISSGTDTLVYYYTFSNDNWDYPRPTSDLKMTCLGGFKVDTGEDYMVSATPGVTTTILQLSAVTGGRGESGEMFQYTMTRASGYTYTSGNGYKPVTIRENFKTDGYSSNKQFIEVYYSGSGPYVNYFSDVFDDSDQDISTADFITYESHYTRYYIRNESGSSADFYYMLNPYEYCTFNGIDSIGFEETFSSLIPGGHVLYAESFTGHGDNVPNIISIPGYTSLSTSDVYSYKYVFHCPTGGQVSLYYAGTNHFFTDGQETSGNTSYYDTEGRPFISFNTASSLAKTTIGGDGIVGGVASVQFGQIDQYIEIVPTSGNVATNSNYPYRLGYYGAY